MAETKLQPQNIDAEKSVIGGILLDKDAILKVAEFLKPEYFYNDKHKAIYAAMVELYDDREPIDIVTVPDKLRKTKELKKIGGVAYITELLNETPSAANIESHGKLVREAFVRRQLIRLSSELGELGFDEDQSIEDLLDLAEQKIFSVSQDNLRGEFVPLRKALEDSFDLLDELYRNKGKLRGVPTGLNALDEKLNGFRKSNLIILAARPSVGKSALLLNMAQHAAVIEKTPVGIFSLEMSTDELVTRMVASQANIDSFKITSGQLSDDELAAYGEASGILADAPIYIDDTPGLTIMELRTKARRLHADKGIQMILVDYLQLMRGRNTENRVQEVSEISWGLKAIARELSIPVLAAAQLSRAVEQRGGDKRPQLSDLRESGCLTGDTEIYLPDKGSYVPIKDLEGKADFNITSLNAKTWKLEASKVSRAFCNGTKSVYEMMTASGRKIKATANHKFLAIDGWRRLDEFEKGEHLAVPRIIPSKIENQTMTSASMALLGHLIGDGCVLPRHSIQYTTREIDLAEIVADLSTQVFGDLINPRINKERNWYQVYLSSNDRLTHGKRNPISEWFEKMGIFGLRSYEKFIPQDVFEQPNSGIAIFLKHLWSTDGCIRMTYGKKPRPAIYYATSSKKLAYGVQSLLLRLQINSRLRKVAQGKKGRTQYHITVSGLPDIQKFAEGIGTIGRYKTESLQEILDHSFNRIENTNTDIIPSSTWKTHVVPAMVEITLTTRKMQSELGMQYCGSALYKSNMSRQRASKVATVVESVELKTLAESDVYWDKITSIEYVGEEKVYDLTVPENHNFIADNIIAHNSIEQDADVVMFLYRPDEDNRSEVNLVISKHRNGPTGFVPLYFRGERTKFYEQTQKEAEGESESGS